MTSEIRANTLKNRVGLGTVSFTNTGPVVSGIVTANSFSGPLITTSIDLNGDLDVDGHTNLDNVSIAGVVTVTGNVTAHDFLPDTNAFRNIGTSSNKFNQVHANTFYGSGDFVDLDVDGHTNLDNVNVAGVSTFTGQIYQTASGSGTAKLTLNNASDTTGMDVGYSESSGVGFINVGQSGSGLSIKTGGLAAGNERLRITSDGKIGIGEDDPDGNYLLIRAASTVGTNKGHIMLTGDSATNGQGPQIVFSESGSGSSFAGAYIGHAREGSNSTGSLIFATRATSGDANTVPTERLRIMSDGEIKINHTQSSTPLNNTFISIWDANSDSSAIDASGVSKNYAMISLHNYGTGAVSDTTGIGFGAGSAFSYTKGSIAFARSGSYGTGDLVFLTNNDQNTTMVNDTDEKLRITRDSKIIFSDCDVSIGRDAALANYADGSTTPTQLAVVKDGGGAGSGYHEVAHFTGGTDSNDTGAIVRITQFNNDRGMFIKAGRGTSDQAKAIIGLRNSGGNDANWLTLIQNTDQVNIHKSVDIDNGANLSIGGITGHAPLHVRSENTSYGKSAVFGASGWVNHANYHYTDATITLLGTDLDGNRKGTGIEMTARNTANTNWMHGALTMDQSGHFRIFAGGAGTTQGTEKLQIDNVGNLKQGTSTPAAFTGSSPSHTMRFLGKKCMQGSVTDTVTLAANGTGTFDLGKLWLTDDTSIELFIQVMRNDSTNNQTHYCKAFIQKVKGQGMRQGEITHQNGEAYSGGSGFRVTGISAGGYTGSGGSAHGTQITVAGGAGGVIYRAVAFWTALSKNDMY